MDIMISGNQEPQTWAKSIQAYRREKTSLSWNPAEVPPPTYVKQFDVSRKSREMDPIIMRHRDPEVELRRKVKEEESLRSALNNARNRQLRVEQNYDIVTHCSHLPGKQEPEVRPTRHPDTRTSYDILNHVPRENAHSLALFYADGESPEVMPQKVVTVEGGKKPRSHLKRDVDVLSNRYLEKHEERMEEEKRFLRQVADDKYSRTHDYNLIAGAYYDKKKEKEFVESRGKLGVMQGRAQQHRLPPSVRYCEGNSFDIINKQQPKTSTVKNETAIAADRGLIKRTLGREVHEESVRQHERAAATIEQRTLNRPSHMRHVEVLRTGHNVISNQVFTGREGKPPLQPRARPPVPVWDRIFRPGATTPGRRSRGGRTEDDEPVEGEGRRRLADDGIDRNRNRSRDGGRVISGRDRRIGKTNSGDHAALVVRSTRQQEGDTGRPKGGREEGNATEAIVVASVNSKKVPPLDLSLQPHSDRV